MLPSQRSHRHVPFKTGGGDVDDQIKKFRSRMFLIHVEEAKEWMERMIGETITVPPDGDADFMDVLRTSEHLAMLGNRFRKKKHKVFRNIDQKDRMAFRKSMDNFQNFQASCIECGFPKFMLCSFEDLYKRKNITSVIQTIHAYADHLVRKGYITEGEGMKDFEEQKDDFDFSEKAMKKIEEDFQKIEKEKGRLNLDFSSHKKKKVEAGPPKKRRPAPLPPMNPSLIFFSGSNCGVRGEKGTFKLSLPIPNDQEFDVNFDMFLRNKRTNEMIRLDDIVKEKSNSRTKQTNYIIHYNIPIHGDFEVLTKINNEVELKPWDFKVYPHNIDKSSINFSKPYDLFETTNEFTRDIDWDHLRRGKDYAFRLKLKDIHTGNPIQLDPSKKIPFDINFYQLSEDGDEQNKKNFKNLTDIRFFGNGEFEVRFKCPFDGKFQLDVDYLIDGTNEKDNIFQKLCICDSTKQEIEERLFLEYLPTDDSTTTEKNIGIDDDSNNDNFEDELNELGITDDKNMKIVECIVRLRGDDHDRSKDFFFSFEIKSDDDENLKKHKFHQKQFEEMFQKFVFDKYQELLKLKPQQLQQKKNNNNNDDDQDILKFLLNDELILEEFGNRLMRQKFCKNDLYLDQEDMNMKLRIENFRFCRWAEEEEERRREMERQRQLEDEEMKRLKREKELEEENWNFLRQYKMEEEKRRKLEEEQELERLRLLELERQRQLEEEEHRRRQEEEHRRRLQLLEEQKRRMVEEEERRRRERAAHPFPIPRSPPWTMNLHPNRRGAHRKLYNLNFWVMLFLKVEKMKQQIAPKNIDGPEEGNIQQINSTDISLNIHKTPEVYDCSRKRDVLSFGDLLLQTSQNYLFSLIGEIGERAPGMRDKAVKISKGVFTILKDIYDTYRYVLEQTPFLKESPMPYSPIENIEEVKPRLVDLIQATVTEYVKTLHGVCRTLLSIIHSSFTQGSRFLSTDLKHTQLTFRALVYQTLSTTRQRKILVNELHLLNPPQDTREGKPLLTKSHAVTIPFNYFFDNVQFQKNQVFGIATMDDNSIGLKNVWKSAFVRNFTDVKFECIHSNVVSMVPGGDKGFATSFLLPNANATFKLSSLPRVEPGCSKMEIMMSNTRSLLILIACNHVKRFSRQELSGITHQHPLEVPAIFLSLLTPFYFRNEIQNALVHQKLILSALSSVRQVRCDIHDGKEPVTVPVRFSGTPIMLNFGVGVVIKTLQMGIGFQRMLNNRKNGIRPLEIEVMNYLWTMRVKRNELRNQIFHFLNQFLFNQSRTGKFYESSLIQRKEKIDNVNLRLNRYDVERMERCKDDDAQILKHQTKLDELIAEHLEKNLNSVTKLEYYFRLGGIKSTVDKIMKLHKKIYVEIEKKYDELWTEEIHWEGMLVSELNSVLQKFPFLNLNQALQNVYDEYQDISTRMIDMTNLFMDFRTLYFERRHESFSLNPLKKSTSEVMVHDPYDLPVRLLLLGFGLGYQLHLSSRNGGERCNEAIDQMLEYTEMRTQFGKFPSILRDTQKFHNWRKKIHSSMSINAGSFDLNRLNNGMPASDRDASVAGRFYKLEEFERYKGLYHVLKEGMEIAGKKGQDAFLKYKKIRGRQRQ